MPSENHLIFKDVLTGNEVTGLDKLVQAQPGYDSYFTEMTKPDTLINTSKKGVARYLSTLPINGEPLSLGEGSTPLVPSKVFDGVYIKNEGLNPTGNFKDRESAITLQFAKEMGYKNVAIVSSGNAALSSALYARIHGINITCYVPSRTPGYKMSMIDMFGGRTHVVGDSYEETYHYLLENLPPGSVNITSGVLPIRSDGVKTIAYEIWEDLGKVPDVIVCPAGNGSALAAIYHGFCDLKKWGFTDKIPTMVCVQIKGADPINQSLLTKKPFTILEDIPDSQCEAIVAQESYCSPKAVHAIQQSGGFGVSVTDHQVIDGLRYAIDNEGVFPEFSSASVFAVMSSYEQKIREKGSTIVLINSATGLKELQSLQNLLKA